MNKLVPLMAATAALLATPALAQEGTELYGSVGYSHISVDDLGLGAITGRFGARFMPNLGVEGEASFGVMDDSVDIDFGPPIGVEEVDFKLQNDFSVYVIGFVPTSENFDLFARVGYGASSAEGEAAGVSVDEDGAGFRVGAGGQFFFDGVNGVRGEYTRFDGDEGLEADVFSLSYVRRFR